MSGEKTTNVSKITPKALPVADGRYLGWVCSECKREVAALQGMKPAALDLLKQHQGDWSCTFACPHCGANRIYQMKDAIHVLVT
jgi:DNA-directed RNA polymerase subunit RPC12/RpoP